MLVPPTELSAGPFPSLSLTLNFPLFRPLWRTALDNGVTLDTSVLHAGDALAALMALAAVLLEKKTDDAMYAYQEAKHGAIRAAKRASGANEEREAEPETGVPKAVKDVPVEYWPGFPTKGLHSVVRHPNFAGEQSFWLAQALLGLGAGPVAPRVGGCLLPPFLVSSSPKYGLTHS